MQARNDAFLPLHKEVGFLLAFSMKQVVKQYLEKTKDKYRLITQYDTLDVVEKANYERKKEVGKGFSKKKLFREIAEIPIHDLMKLEPWEREEILTNDNAMRIYLKNNPHFRNCEGGI